MSLYVTCTNLIKLDNDTIGKFLWKSGKITWLFVNELIWFILFYLLSALFYISSLLP